jgi:hypothetical protein
VQPDCHPDRGANRWKSSVCPDTHELHREVRVPDGVISLIHTANDLRKANSAYACLAFTLPSQFGSGAIGIRAVRAIASETFFAVAVTHSASLRATSAG